MADYYRTIGFQQGTQVQPQSHPVTMGTSQQVTREVYREAQEPREPKLSEKSSSVFEHLQGIWGVLLFFIIVFLIGIIVIIYYLVKLYKKVGKESKNDPINLVSGSLNFNVPGFTASTPAQNGYMFNNSANNSTQALTTLGSSTNTLLFGGPVSTTATATTPAVNGYQFYWTDGSGTKWTSILPGSTTTPLPSSQVSITVR
jgi:cytoskeletal protein RodZ